MTQTSVQAPPRLFTCFAPDTDVAERAVGPGERVTRYTVERVHSVRGAPLDGVGVGTSVSRVESKVGFAVPGAALVGVTGHLVYTGRAERTELVARSAPESGPVAVLIPIRKSPEWWALPQDERQAHFAALGGHLTVGMQFVHRIFRRLYHSRYAPGSAWDFLTYFEFPEDRTAEFHELLGGLRDPERNPEWALVDREAEVWMTKIG
jgi:hypothetical protein